MNRNNIKVEKLVPETYDIEFLKQGGRYQCMNCGDISVFDLYFDTPYLDLHCKCGAPVTRIYPDE